MQPLELEQRSLASVIDDWAQTRPDAAAFVGESGEVSWARYSARSRDVADQLVSLGLEVGERVAVLLPDGAGVHVAFVGIEKAGLVAVGIGPRAGLAEIRHLLSVTGASAFVSAAHRGDLEMRELVDTLRCEGLKLRHHLIFGDTEIEDVRSFTAVKGRASSAADRRLGPDDLFLLNSTSGTTGLPKCVCHDQRRWFAFHAFALRTGELTCDDRFCSVVPAPFGFGIWTSHVTPALLGAPVLLDSPFDAERTLRLIEAHRITVLAAVSTQFIMMLNSPAMDSVDLTSLRVLYTGGEAVPYERAAAFEERTGAAVLQFYGSNETGAVSGTSLADSREKRLRTAGRPIPEMNVRLFDDDGREVTAEGRGLPGCRGPTLSRGYYEDTRANAKLLREDGWMMLEDIATLDQEGYLSVVGRAGDFIIRGGKNISGPAVEQAVALHPSVVLAAAVAMPDPVFGERVCVFVELDPECELSLEDLVADLRERGVSKEMLPERLEVLTQLPRGSGGKIAKQLLREKIRERLRDESSRPPESIDSVESSKSNDRADST